MAIAAGKGSAGNKPRPVLIIQDNAITGTATVVMAPFTSTLIDSNPARPRFHPSDDNGLREASELMIDKIASPPRATIGKVVGRLTAEDMDRVDAALRIVLGLAR